MQEEELIMGMEEHKKRKRESESGSKHPVYRGVRMRSWGKWVSEIRQPRKNSRIWLGTYPTAEMAARAHDVGVLSIKGNSKLLNFPDLIQSLPRPASLSPRDVQAAAAQAAAMEEMTLTPSSSLSSSSSSSSSSLSSSSSSSSLSLSIIDSNSTVETSTAELEEIIELPSLEASFKSSELTLSHDSMDDGWMTEFGFPQWWWGDDAEVYSHFLDEGLSVGGLFRQETAPLETLKWDSLA